MHTEKIAFRYQHQLKQNEVIVRLIDTSSQTQELEESIRRYSEKYGFSFHTGTKLSSRELTPEIRKALVIYRTNSPLNEPDIDWATTMIRAGWQVSLAFRYSSREEMYKQEATIEQYKASIGDNINFLMPDTDTQWGVTVSNDKISENSVCDSVRIKFTANCRCSTPPTLGEDEKQFFTGASEAYLTFKMFLRSPTDGYFAMRRGDDFLITCTKTNKVEMDLNRLAVVHNFDEEMNRIEYSGAFLPSSDCIEAASVFSQTDHNFLIHTHASKMFTRNPAFSDFITVPELPYGTTILGKALSNALSHGNQMTIMKEHGEVFAGKNYADTMNYLRRQVKQSNFTESIKTQLTQGKAHEK